MTSDDSFSDICATLREARVCITGGQGALGRRLLWQLVSVGVRNLVVLDRAAKRPNQAIDKNSYIRWLTGDVLDPEAVDRAVAGSDIVFHLAGLVDAAQSTAHPLAYFQVNALGTAQVLEACRRRAVAHVVYVSTAHVYGIPRTVPVEEGHPTDPGSPYAASKLGGELVIRTYARMGSMSGIVARLANVYGAPFAGTTVVGRALQSALTGGPVVLRTLAPVRDFLYVDDAVRALVRLAASPARECETVNVGTGRGVSVGQMAQALVRIAQELGLGTLGVHESAPAEADPVPELVLDTRRLAALTGWTPSVALETGLRRSLTELRERQPA